MKVAGILQANGRKYSLRGESATNLLDLRGGPTIFVGAFDNAWTLRLTRPLRYHFANNAEMTQFRIVDSNAPALNRWTVDRSQQMATNNYRDYAIIARFTAPAPPVSWPLSLPALAGAAPLPLENFTDPDNLAELMRAAKPREAKRT